MSVSSAQNAINTVQREIQNLNRKLSDLARIEASKSSKSATVLKSITKSTSLSSRESKQREMQRLAEDIAGIQGKKATVSKDIATKTEKLHKSQLDFYTEQRKEHKRSIESLDLQRREQDRVMLKKLHNRILPVSSKRASDTAAIYDAFIAHATEDKEEFVRPLAGILQNMGHAIWYDEFQLTVGDSLRRSIDKGLVSSRFGIVVLSPSFFEKQWPQYELDGLVAKESAGGKVILPVWHKVSKNEVIEYSPTLADKVALETALYTIEELGALLSGALKAPKNDSQ